MAELKRCPFCGGEAEIHMRQGRSLRAISDDFLPTNAVVTRRVNEYKGVFYYVPKYTPRCRDSSCPGRLGKTWPTVEQATVAWNRRSDDAD